MYSNYIVQKYIENPILIENKKFDIRCYLMVASTKPYLALYHPGFVRRSLFNYSITDSEQDDYIHLTNVEV